MEGAVFDNEEEMLTFERNHLADKQKRFIWARYSNKDARAFMIVIAKRHYYADKRERFFRRADKLYSEYKTSISL